MDIKSSVKKMKQGGFTLDEANKIAESLAINNGWDKEQALLQVEMIYKAGPIRNIQGEVGDWVAVTSGYFSVTDVDKELLLVTQQHKNSRKVALHRLCEGNILVRHPNKNGVYRKIEKEAAAIEWKNADPNKVLDLRFPFGLEGYADLFPGNLMVLAGAKSAGKTAFANNFIYLNQNSPKLPQPIYLFSSQGSPEELHKRFKAFDLPLPEWTFEARRRTSNFGDAIVKDHINVIDFLRMPGGEYYLVRDELQKIVDNLGSGFALVCLQKPVGRELGLGGQASIEECSYYIALEKGNLLIVDAKFYKNNQNPCSKKFTFKLVGGARFVDIKEVTSGYF